MPALRTTLTKLRGAETASVYLWILKTVGVSGSLALPDLFRRIGRVSLESQRCVIGSQRSVRPALRPG